MKFVRIVYWSSIGLLMAVNAAAQSTTVNVQVGNQINPSVGVNGRLQVAMSTSLQLASWNEGFFSGAPSAPANLTALNPFHTRVQVVSDGIPQTANGAWSFKELDTMLSPIQATGDHSPEFQIGTAPAFLSAAVVSPPVFFVSSAVLCQHLETCKSTLA